MQYNSMTCTAQNIHVINGLLARMYSFLQFHSGIRDISKSVTLPKMPKKGRGIEVWTDNELETITAALPTAPRIRFLTVLLMSTGCRISELLGLKYSDIGDHVLSINKQLVKYTDLTGSGRKGWYDVAPPKSEDSCREIPLSDYVMDELRLHRKWHLGQMEKHGFRTDFIFTTRTGHFIDKRSETITFRRFYERIGVPYRSFHVYRHTFGTNLCKKGVPIQIASELLGHSSISITAKYYVNVNEQQKIDAVNLLVPQCARHSSNDSVSPSPTASITQG
jgi:integrase